MTRILYAIAALLIAGGSAAWIDGAASRREIARGGAILETLGAEMRQAVEDGRLDPSQLVWSEAMSENAAQLTRRSAEIGSGMALAQLALATGLGIAAVAFGRRQIELRTSRGYPAAPRRRGERLTLG